MRRGLIVAVLAALAVLVPVAVQAFTPTGGSALDSQTFIFKTGSAVTTSSTHFNNVPGLSHVTVCAQSALSISVSVQLSGGPVSLRVRITPRSGIAFFAKPGFIRFEPQTTDDPFSFTWVVSVSNESQIVSLQWKSPTGATVTARAGDMNVLYQNSSGPCG